MKYPLKEAKASPGLPGSLIRSLEDQLPSIEKAISAFTEDLTKEKNIFARRHELSSARAILKALYTLYETLIEDKRISEARISGLISSWEWLNEKHDYGKKRAFALAVMKPLEPIWLEAVKYFSSLMVKSSKPMLTRAKDPTFLCVACNKPALVVSKNLISEYGKLTENEIKLLRTYCMFKNGTGVALYLQRYEIPRNYCPVCDAFFCDEHYPIIYGPEPGPFSDKHYNSLVCGNGHERDFGWD